MEYNKKLEDIDRIKEEINKTIDEKTQLWEDVEDLELEILDVKKMINDKQIDIEEMEEDHESLQSQIKNLKETIIETEEEIIKKKTELETLERSRDYLELEVLNVEKTGGDFSLILDRLQRELKEIQDKIIPSKQELHRLMEANQDQDSENVRLQAELDPLLDDLDYKRSACNSLEKSKWKLEDELEDTNADIQEYLKAVLKIILFTLLF